MEVLSTSNSKTDYLNHLTAAISTMRLDLDFTDIDLEVEDQLLSAHRLILSGASSYFRAMFKSGMREAASRKVKISGMSFDAMEIILHYIYTGDLQMEDNTSSLLSVLSGAHILQLSSLFDQCFQLLTHEDRLKDCFAELWRLAELYDECKREEKICEYVKCNFSDLISSSQFLLLTLKQLKALVESSLNCSTDHAVQAILLWVSHDTAQRQDNLFQLLSSVPLESLTGVYIRKLQEHDLIKERCDVLHLLLKAALGEVPEDGQNVQRTVFCFGRDPSKKSFMAMFPEKENKWETRPSPFPVTIGVCITFYHGCIYFVGGGDSAKESTSSVQQYSLKNNITKTVKPLSVPKLFAGAAVFRNKLYIVGGSTTAGALTDVDAYDAASDTWQPIAPTNQKHYVPQVIVAAGHLYVVGSYESTTVEKYNPLANQWTQLKSVPFMFQLFAPHVTVLHNKLHILQRKQIVFVYNPLSNAWETEAVNQQLAELSHDVQTENRAHTHYLYLVEINSAFRFDMKRKLYEELCRFPPNIRWNLWQTIVV